jgi:hypothetical protein
VLLVAEFHQMGKYLVDVESCVLDKDARDDLEGLSVLSESVLVEGLDLVGFFLEDLG